MLLADPPSRRRAALRQAGHPLVWKVAAAVGIPLVVVVLAWLAIPRDTFTGTNSVATRSVVTDLDADRTLCVRRLTVPAGTGQIRLQGGVIRKPAATRLDVTVTGGGRTVRGTLRDPRLLTAPGIAPVDVAVPRFARDTAATICVTPRGGTMWLGGMLNMQGNDVPPLIDGKPLNARVAVWYLPPAGEKTSLLADAPAAFARMALFRPGIVGAWTYWLLFVVLLPALALGALALLARSAGEVPARLPRPLAVFLVGLACAGSFALITPIFQAPDESEHFAAVQYMAETGKAVDRFPSAKNPYSLDERIAIEGVRLFSTVESASGRPPWRKADERAYETRTIGIPDGIRTRDDGGGFAVATSAHSPLFYALAAPFYLAAGGAEVPTQVTFVRAFSSILIALVALFAFLTVRELVPRRYEWAAVTAGLFVAFQPMIGFMGGAINNDNGISAVAAALVWLSIRGLRRGLSWRLGLALGALLAIAPLMKGTGYFLYPPVALAVLGMLWRGRSERDPARPRRRLPSRPVLTGVGVVVLALVAVSAAWLVVAPVFGRTLLTAPSGNNATQGVLAASDPVGYLSYVWQLFFPGLPGMTNIYGQRVPFVSIYIIRGWGAFGWYAILFPHWITLVISGGILAGSALIASALARFRDVWRRMSWEILVLLAVPVCVFLGVEAVYASVTPRPGPVAEQGRYIFPAAVALAAAGVAACFGLGRRRALGLATGAVVLLVGLSVYARLLEVAGFFT